MLISTTLRVQIAFLKYDFLIHGGPIYLHIKYRNFAQSPFNFGKSKYISNFCTAPLGLSADFPKSVVAEYRRSDENNELEFRRREKKSETDPRRLPPPPSSIPPIVMGHFFSPPTRSLSVHLFLTWIFAAELWLLHA